jgi:hypothetical protein
VRDDLVIPVKVLGSLVTLAEFCLSVVTSSWLVVASEVVLAVCVKMTSGRETDERLEPCDLVSTLLLFSVPG